MAAEYRDCARRCRELAAVLSRADEREHLIEEARRYDALAEMERSFQSRGDED